jgi:hypothetical protein
MASAGGANEVRSIGGPLDEYAVITAPNCRDIAVAERLVIVHKGEDWPTGCFCRNCHARYPCRLSWWGTNVLLAAEWSEADIAELENSEQRRTSHSEPGTA